MRGAKFFRLGAAVGLLALFLAAGNSGFGWAQGQLPPVRTLGFGAVYSVAFSLDGRYLAAGAASAVHLIDTTTWAVVHTLSRHTDRVNSVAFSPDGRLLASGSDDKTIKLWYVGDLTGK